MQTHPGLPPCFTTSRCWDGISHATVRALLFLKGDVLSNNRAFVLLCCAYSSHYLSFLLSCPLFPISYAVCFCYVNRLSQTSQRGKYNDSVAHLPNLGDFFHAVAEISKPEKSEKVDESASIAPLPSLDPFALVAGLLFRPNTAIKEIAATVAAKVILIMMITLATWCCACVLLKRLQFILFFLKKKTFFLAYECEGSAYVFLVHTLSFCTFMHVCSIVYTTVPATAHINDAFACGSARVGFESGSPLFQGPKKSCANGDEILKLVWTRWNNYFF